VNVDDEGDRDADEVEGMEADEVDRVEDDADETEEEPMADEARSEREENSTSDPLFGALSPLDAERMGCATASGPVPLRWRGRASEWERELGSCCACGGGGLLT